MKTLVAINPNTSNKINYTHLGEINFGSISMELGIIDLPKPKFNIKEPKNYNFVLLKVHNLSCNYRDKSILLENFKKIKRLNYPYVPFGSEFCAEVIDIGENVTNFNIGDIVIPNCSYSNKGIPTNYASLGWLKLHEDTLIKKPVNINNNEAAGFSLGAQTACSMIRKSKILETGGVPLIFSSRSNTSLFLIEQLVKSGVTPICLSTSNWEPFEVQKLGSVIMQRLDKGDHSKTLKSIKKYNVTHVFDPFFDTNINFAMECLQVDGTYVTCGIRDQHPILSEQTPKESGPIIRSALTKCIFKNITFIGNCLGSR
ncbi:hypothetical protein M4L90_07110 [Staphylococcus equorum]|uniref:Alcohol dehydrogenase-like N-terminal domain-containing protein n=1 Tax=Staphylococcus equorum TaxID=246432 RepID=A0A9X4L4K3_9STAP|nr:alcohol dehydrogenase catalytic domain-containing protein [Staphylococcus equorum]MDG0819669.1 hypothetical protein [Staphylococcus equorum]MDG0840310.1 hypothetical protein [Staphylococcus equorum]MDG0845993.1 hypothetical protein [Staphylococcus equorum]